MRITIQIDTDNAAFDFAPMDEAIAILDRAAAKLENMPVGSEEHLLDTNGNSCGFVSVSY
jgi:hypothetical protein